MVVATGLLNWLQLGKGAEYYSNNSIFLLKFSLFIIISLLSIYPTVVITKLKKRYKKVETNHIEIPNYPTVIGVIKTEISILILLPLLATLMANGFDFSNL